MPSSSANRMKKFIEQLKLKGLYDDYKKKRNEAAQRHREKTKETTESLSKRLYLKKLSECREKTKQRVRKHRLNKKISQNDDNVKQSASKKKRVEATRERVRKSRENKKIKIAMARSSSNGTYNTDAALRKATSRTRTTLPKNEKKRETVLMKLNQQYLPSLVSSMEKKKITRSNASLSTSVKESVIEFYDRVDISSQAPGRKDFVSVLDEDGNKVKHQTKYLMYPIREVYAKFCKEYGSVPLKRSKFFELRPKYILSASETPANLCLCVYHADFMEAVNSISKVIPEMPMYGDGNIFYETFFCETMSKQCWLNECENCKGVFNDTVRAIGESHPNVMATWHQWIKNPRWKNEVFKGTLKVLVDHILTIAPDFFVHNYVKRSQIKSYVDIIKVAKENSKIVVVHVDYAENYTCVSQDEVANAHWGQQQVTLFTSEMWCNRWTQSFSITSDDMTHAKETIVPYVDRLFEEIPEGTEDVHVWSDGPSSQFKNKFMVVAQRILQEKYNVNLFWNFFPTSHGKGPVDGIGGALKRQVWLEVKNRNCTVSNASEFAEAVSENSKVKVIHMDSNEITERLSSLKLDEEWKNAPNIRGILNYHHIQITDGKVHGFLTTMEGMNCDNKV